MSKRKYYVKERQNPQIGTYYIVCGQLTKKEAKQKETSLYGMNIMHKFNTEEEYTEFIGAVRTAGGIFR